MDEAPPHSFLEPHDLAGGGFLGAPEHRPQDAGRALGQGDLGPRGPARDGVGVGGDAVATPILDSNEDFVPAQQCPAAGLQLVRQET